MSDEEQVSQALAELWDIVRCRCHEAYAGRGLHDPDCQCDSTDALQIVTHRIKALTEQLAAAQQDAKEAEAYAEELEADRKKTYEALLKVSRIHGEVEAKLAKAENALFTLSHIHDGNPSDSMADILPLDYARHMLWEARSIARAALATLKGRGDE